MVEDQIRRPERLFAQTPTPVIVGFHAGASRRAAISLHHHDVGLMGCLDEGATDLFRCGTIMHCVVAHLYRLKIRLSIIGRPMLQKFCGRFFDGAHNAVPAYCMHSEADWPKLMRTVRFQNTLLPSQCFISNRAIIMPACMAPQDRTCEEMILGLSSISESRRRKATGNFPSKIGSLPDLLGPIDFEGLRNPSWYLPLWKWAGGPAVSGPDLWGWAIRPSCQVACRLRYARL